MSPDSTVLCPPWDQAEDSMVKALGEHSGSSPSPRVLLRCTSMSLSVMTMSSPPPFLFSPALQTCYEMTSNKNTEFPRKGRLEGLGGG